MSLASGARLGPYEIIAPLGAGGMGEVYRARDTRLDRTVAIKVLPEALAADQQFRERFDREARAISQLDHPNICTLYDVGEAELPGQPASSHQPPVTSDEPPATSHQPPATIRFLVMQYLEGQTLDDRLKQGPVPFEQAIQIAVEILRALDKAHRAGVVHRDFKPGNIMLTKSGAKLLDFGLARSGVPVVATSGLSMMPTTPANLTARGTILGTFQYMAPEQLEGEEADARTDIFAFGAVLHEMLTGRKAFEGKSQVTLLAAIVGSEPPPVSTLLPIAPSALDEVVRVCLAKAPDRRWQSATDIIHALTLASKYSSGGAVVAHLSSRIRERVAWGVAAVLALAIAGGVGWLWFGRRVVEPPRMSFDINTETAPSPLQIALSPDGTRLMAIATNAQGNGLWVRRLDETTGQMLPGTAGASFPFWSPDGRFIALFQSGKLSKMDPFGGPVQPLCDAPVGHGGTWNRDGVIVFAPSADGPLFSVRAVGGVPAQATDLDKGRGDSAHRHPKFLPDGQHFVFFVASTKPENTGLYVGALNSKETRRLVASDAMGLFAPPDRLLFMRGSTLMVQSLDLRALEVRGDPLPVASSVGVNTTNSVGGVAVSETGVLAYRIGGSINDRILRWVDRNGNPTGDVESLTAHENVRISPDGQRLVETRLDGSSGDIWTIDLQRGSSSRFTFDPALDDNAVWSPDGGRIVFSSARDGVVRNLYVKSAGGAGQEDLLLKTDTSKYPTDWSRDGRYILYTDVRTSTDVFALPLSGDKKPIALLATPFNENRARFSPDGHWIAYVSDESAVGQIYVQSFPPNGSKWQVSTAGGVEPHWRGDGRELYYVSAGTIWSADITSSDAQFKAGAPRKLFNLPGMGTGTFVTRYDVTPDGQRFLVNLNSVTANSIPPIRVIVNWATGLR